MYRQASYEGENFSKTLAVFELFALFLNPVISGFLKLDLLLRKAEGYAQ